MGQLLFVLFVIGIVLSAVTLVGHGIWVLLAFLFRGGEATAPASRRCASCGSLTSALESRCQCCGRLLNDRLADELADLAAVDRELPRLGHAGAISAEETADLLVRVRDYRQKLLSPPAPAERPAAAVETPIVAWAVPEPTPSPAVVARSPARPVVQPQAMPIPRPQPIAPPQETWADLLTGFMEERNIRWAELVGVLVGGLLIVGSSLALVVSFWDTLQESYLKFLVFVGYSSAVFGVGLFAYHRWKLVSTGRGLLAIATLLVPLNFVAMASLSPESWSWQTAATELVSLGIFAGLSALAADALAIGRRWSLVLAVLGNSALVLLAARLLGEHTSSSTLLAVCTVPAALLATAVAGQAVGSPGRRLQAADATARFTLLGMAVFASAVAEGVLIARGCKFLDLRSSLYCLAPSLALAAWPILASGLRIMRGMARDQSLEAFRAAGTTVALVGVGLQLAALALCWPQPLGLVVVGLLGAASLIFAAVRFRFPVAHAGAMLCLALAYVAGFHWLTDEGLRAMQAGSLIISDAGLGLKMMRLFASARSATSLCGLFLGFAAIAAWFARSRRNRHAVAYVLGCGATAAVAVPAVMMLALLGTHADALQAAWVYTFYGVACVLISTRWQRQRFSYVGWNLLAAAPFWTLTTPLLATWQSTAALAGCLFWLAAVWLLLAWLHQNRDLLSAQQVALTAATVVAATAWLQAQNWVGRLPDDLLEPRNLQCYGIALGAISLAWIIARIALRDNPASRGLLTADEPGVDWAIRHAVVWLQTLVAAACVTPSVIQELSAHSPGAHAADAVQRAWGPAAWILLGLLAVMLIAALWERWRSAEMVGLLLLGPTAACLAAGRFAGEVAVGSALRWGLAISFLVGSAFIWQRHRLLAWSRLAKTRVVLDSDGPRIARTVLLTLTAWPVFIVTFFAAVLRFASVTPGGPAAGSCFDQLGLNVSYLVPMGLVILGLAGYAVREVSTGYALSAGLVAQLTAAMGYALCVVTDPDPARTFGIRDLITSIQLATITAAAWAIAWLAAGKWLPRLHPLVRRENPFLTLHVALPMAANAMLLLVPVLRLLAMPAYLSPWMSGLADRWGWIGLLLTAAAIAWRLQQTQPSRLVHVLGATMLGVGVLVACGTGDLTSPGLANWLPYHMLTTAWAAAALCVLGAGFVGRKLSALPSPLVAKWVTLIGTLAVFLAMIYSPTDREGAWWSIRAIGSMSIAAAILALWLRSPIHVFLSGLLFAAIGVVGWLAWGNVHDVVQLIHVVAICLAAASGIWTALELIVPQGVPHLPQERRCVVFAHVAAGAALVAMAILAAEAILCDLHVVPHLVVTRLAWIALATVAAAIALGLWDRLARLTLCGLYLAALTALAMYWDRLQPTPPEVSWRAASQLAAFVLGGAIVGWLTGKSDRVCRLLRIPSGPDRWSAGWFMRLQMALTAVAAGLAVWVSIDFAFDGVGHESAWFAVAGRMAGAAGPMMLLVAAVLMAQQSAIAQWRFRWQYAALTGGLLLASCCGWAALDPAAGLPAAEAPWLHRSVILLAAAAIMIVASAFGLGRALPKTSDWIAVGRRAALHFSGLAMVTIAIVLVQEGALFDGVHGIPLATSANAVVTATLALLIVACIAWAVAPRWEPFGLTDRGRQAYVYAAEVLSVLIGLHVWMTVPWLFRLGLIERYWMFLVMAVAFAGAGLSEFFHRRRLPVLSEPLERTALLLPLLPAVGFWFAPESASVWALMGRTPVLWFLMGAFYGSLACMRRSLGCAALATLAANIGLWVAWHQLGIGILQHPQLWLIPIALAALVAEYLNHDRLSAAQSAAFRYLALSVIYLSSTADMFIAGLGKDWRLPLVLMLLSVAGVLAGLVMRIRSFLLLGIVFLLLDIVAMIWYAAVDLEQTWIWYACGIVLGAAIIGLFALFEKRRNDLLAAVKKLKQWER
jgi:hypothetical protein